MGSTTTLKDHVCTGTASDVLNPFRVVPQEVMKHIYTYLNTTGPPPMYAMDIRDVLRFSCCDSYLNNLICRKSPFLWKDIQLIQGAKDLTDDQLRALLERINAVKVTRTLILEGCSVTGAGLSPLLGSEVLETADLRVTNCDFRFDQRAVANILSSMLPHRIEHVKLNPIHNEVFEWGDFITRLSLRKARCATAGGAKCSSCRCLLADKLNNVKQVFDNLPLNIKCFTCQGFTCRPFDSAGECKTVQKCTYCHYPFCLNGRCSALCVLCSNSSCPACANVSKCTICRTNYCVGCDEAFLCNRCNKVVCVSCTEYSHCENCGENFCEACDDSAYCEACDIEICKRCRFICTGCDRGLVCAVCDIWLGCEQPRERCPYCFASSCPECAPYHTKCVSPGVLTFGDRPGVSQKMCNCGCVSVPDTVKGQRFICGYFRKKMKHTCDCGSVSFPEGAKMQRFACGYFSKKVSS